MKNHRRVVVPLTTKTGVQIGANYTPPLRINFSRDEELLQDALLNGRRPRRVPAWLISLALILVAYLLIAWRLV